MTNNYDFKRYVDVFLWQEMQKYGFNRYDIVVRLLAIEEYYHKNNYGFCLYDKMQQKRFKEKPFIPEAREQNCIKKFCNLIESVEKYGYLTHEYPILLNDCNCLINGAHRLALCIYHNIDFVNCVYSVNATDYHTHVVYNFDWFQHHFSEEECLIIKSKLKKIIELRGYLSYSIIWPAAHQYRNKIERLISQYFDIISYYDLIFKSKSSLSKFIKLVYSIDPYRFERTNDKMKNISDETVICVRILQMKHHTIDNGLNTLIYEDKDVCKYEVSYLKNAKYEIRTAIQQFMDEYVFDNAFHCGHTLYENIFLQNIYERYQNKKGLIL